MRDLLLTLEAAGYEVATVLCRPEILDIDGDDVEIETAQEWAEIAEIAERNAE